MRVLFVSVIFFGLANDASSYSSKPVNIDCKQIATFNIKLTLPNHSGLLTTRLRGGEVKNKSNEGQSDADRLAAAAEELFADINPPTAPSGLVGKANAAFCDCISAAFTFFLGGSGGVPKRAARDAKLEAAADQFVRAATAFKLERKWRRAGEVLVRAGDCYAMHSELGFEAVRCLRFSWLTSHRFAILPLTQAPHMCTCV